MIEWIDDSYDNTTHSWNECQEVGPRVSLTLRPLLATFAAICWLFVCSAEMFCRAATVSAVTTTSTLERYEHFTDRGLRTRSESSSDRFSMLPASRFSTRARGDAGLRSKFACVSKAFPSRQEFNADFSMQNVSVHRTLDRTSSMVNA